MNTWTPQTGVKYPGLSTSPKKKQKQKKQKKKNALGRHMEERPGREKSGGSGLQEKKKKVSRNKVALNHSWLHHSNRDRCDNDTSGKSGKTSDTQQSHSAQLSQAAHSKHTQAASPGKQEAWLGDSFRHRDRPKPVKRIGWTSKTALNRKGLF